MQRITVLSLMAFPIIGMLLYVNVLKGEFQFDDKPFIVQNDTVHDLNYIGDVFSFDKARTVGLISFALNYHFHKLDVFGYHLVNVIIHVINALLVFWLTRLLCAQVQFNAKATSNIPFFTSLLFLTHPVQTQAVSYITQRFASLATLFYLFSICSYIQARILPHFMKRGLFFGLSVFSAFLGVFTKEITFTLPIMIAIAEFYFFRKEKVPIHGNNKTFSAIMVFFMIVLTAFIIPLISSFDVSRVIFAQYESGSYWGDVITWDKYFLTQFKVLVIYLGLLFMPLNQQFDYHIRLVENIYDPMTLAGIFLLISLLMGCIVSFKRNKLVSFGLAWFLVTRMVESSVIPIPHVIFEHRLYLPTIGFFMSLITFSFDIVKKRNFLIILLIAISAFFSLLTISRNQVWRTEIALWSDNLRMTPYKERVYANLSAAYIEKAAYDEARNVLELALSRGVESPRIYLNLGATYLIEKEFDRAEIYFGKALQMSPNYILGMTNYGLLMLKQDYKEEAKDLLIRAVRTPGENLTAAYNLGKIFWEEGDFPAAISIFEQILDKYPRKSPIYYIELTEIYYEYNQPHRAQEVVGRGLVFFGQNKKLLRLQQKSNP